MEWSKILEVSIPVLITATITGLVALRKHRAVLKKEKELAMAEMRLAKAYDESHDVTIKNDVYESLLTMQSVNQISLAVREMFKETIADRFLIGVGIEKNGRVEHISMIFEQHDNDETVSAIARYHHVGVDDPYRDMMKESELRGMVSLEVDTMKESLLKFWYQKEKVRYSQVRFLGRKNVVKKEDIVKDVVSISSIATHVNRAWSNEEMAFIKAKYDSVILPIMKNIMMASEDGVDPFGGTGLKADRMRL